MAEGSRQDERSTAASAGAAEATARQRMDVRLAPVGNSDQPVLTNYTSISPAPGMAFIDFSFLEPALLAALPRAAKQGVKLPQSLNGKLAVWVAIGYDGLAGLHQQVGRVLAGLRKARKKAN